MVAAVVQRHYTVYDPGATRSAFFIEKSLALLRPRGVLGYITGDCWLHVKSGTPLRELLLGRQIDEIVIAGDGTCFLRLENAPPAHPFVARLAGPNPGCPRGPPGISGRPAGAFGRGLEAS